VAAEHYAAYAISDADVRECLILACFKMLMYDTS